MAKFGIVLLEFALLASCSYDAGHLLRPAEKSAAADASRSDTSTDKGPKDTREADGRAAGISDPRDADIRRNDSAVGDAGKNPATGNDADLVAARALWPPSCLGARRGRYQAMASSVLAWLIRSLRPHATGCRLVESLRRCPL